MYLSQLKIWNFRKFGLREGKAITDENPGLCIEFEPGLNVLAGENDSGKSSIIDAIRYTLDTNAAERIYLLEDDFNNGAKNLRIGLTFKFQDCEDPISLSSSFTDHLSYDSNMPILHITLFAQITERTTRGQRYIERKIKTGINGTGNILEGELREFIKTTYLRPLRDAQTALAAGKGSRLSQILSGHNEITNARDNLIKHLIEANKNISGEKVITETQNNINDNFLRQMTFADDSLCAKINLSDSCEFDKLSDREKDLLLKKILERLNLTLIDDGVDYQSPHGLGYNNLMFIATELLLLEQEKDENLPLLLVEEPEAHLHPQMQLQLLEFIKSKSGIQTVLSTHSPNLASKVPTEKIHLLSKGNAFSLRKGATKLKDDDYVFLNKFLDVTKSNLFFARGVIIVEGDAENILLPTLAKLIGCPLEKYGVSIVNVGHTGLFRFSRILQRNDETTGLLPINVACITDRDLRPVCVRYREDKDGNKDNPDGFIKETSRNKSSFEDYYNDDKKVDNYLTNKKKNDIQNVQTFVSPKWTLEYDLALLGLSKEMYEAINGTTKGFDAIDSSDDEKFAAIIYKPLATDSSKSKAETAYQLSKILERDYWDEKEKKPKSEALLQKLPKYLVRALEFVTKTSIVKEPETEVKDV